MGILTHDEILKLHAAVISAQLVPRRSALLVGIDPRLVSGLPDATTPGDQILHDIGALSDTGALADGVTPLTSWLKNAVACAAGKKEAAVFGDVLERCRVPGSMVLARGATASDRASALRRRFEDDDGRRRLEEALLEHSIVAHDRQVAKSLADCLVLRSFEAGEALIVQGGADTDLYLLLVGTVGVEINGREVAIRRAGQHVGEMAMIDTTAKRSATNRAKEESIAACVPEALFAPIADRHPGMWRRLAVDLGRRLRERGNLVAPARDVPVVLVGSTAKGAAIAGAVQTASQGDPWVTLLWTDDGVGARKTLTVQASELDFGLLVVTADDVVESRTTDDPSPRDNIVFELGLLTGALGRERTFVLRVRGERGVSLPSDLGVQTLDVVADPATDLLLHVGAAVDEIRAIVKRLGTR